MQKVTENYLSKVTRYFYFVTSQHWCKETSEEINNNMIILCIVNFILAPYIAFRCIILSLYVNKNIV